MRGQHRAREIAEACLARLAAIALPAWLRVVAAVTNGGATDASGATNTLRPAELARQGGALGVIDRGREADRIRYRHDGQAPCGNGELSSRLSPPRQEPADALILPGSRKEPGPMPMAA
jgi:hypothetical protein